MKILLEVKSPLKVIVRITEDYWKYIIDIKYKIMAGKEEIVKETVFAPDEIRKSSVDGTVFLYYKKLDNFIVLSRNI